MSTASAVPDEKTPAAVVVPKTSRKNRKPVRRQTVDVAGNQEPKVVEVQVPVYPDPNFIEYEWDEESEQWHSPVVAIVRCKDERLGDGIVFTQDVKAGTAVAFMVGHPTRMVNPMYQVEHKITWDFGTGSVTRRAALDGTPLPTVPKTMVASYWNECAPGTVSNCAFIEAQLFNIGFPVILIVTLRDITKGEEGTVHYGPDYPRDYPVGTDGLRVYNYPYLVLSLSQRLHIAKVWTSVYKDLDPMFDFMIAGLRTDTARADNLDPSEEHEQWLTRIFGPKRQQAGPNKRKQEEEEENDEASSRPVKRSRVAD